MDQNERNMILVSVIIHMPYGQVMPSKLVASSSVFYESVLNSHVCNFSSDAVGNVQRQKTKLG